MYMVPTCCIAASVLQIATVVMQHFTDAMKCAVKEISGLRRITLASRKTSRGEEASCGAQTKKSPAQKRLGQKLTL